MPEYVVLDKDTIKSEIMSYLSIAKKKRLSTQIHYPMAE